MTRKMRWRGAVLAVLFAVLAVPGDGVSGTDHADTGPADLVNRYIELVRRGEFRAATGLWSADFLTAAARLGIVYPDAVLPFDMASPLTLHLADLQAGAARLEVGAGDLSGDDFTVPVALAGAGGGPAYRYAVIREDDTWRLANLAWAATRDWPRTESNYFAIICQDSSLLSESAVASLDDFVAATAVRFGLSPAHLDHLRDVKIPYILADDATVERLTGYATKGMGDLSAGLLVSSQFPHYHEAAHLLVNYALGAAPLHPLPALQEGLATLVGGRWGRSPAVILHMAWANAEMGFAAVADILTRGGFQSAAGGADASYPAAALLCDLIAADAGWPALLDLQRTLAEPPGPGRDANAIAAVIGRACGWSPERPLPNLIAAWEQRREMYRRAGVAPGGWPDRPAPTGDDVDVAVVDGDLVFAVPGAEAMVALLPAATPGEAEAGSPLFAELLPDRPYQGERCGIRCSASSISVYDFTTNRLVGVWVGDFAGEPGGAAAAPGRLVFRVDGNLLPDGAAAGWHVVAP